MLVTAKQQVADGVVSLCLRDPSGDALPSWSPGAHIDLAMTPNLIRQYSLCGDPDDRSQWTVAVLREADGRGGSRFVHEQLRTDDTVLVGGPRNDFALVDAERYLFIAGGIGITPILTMIRSLSKTDRPWRLLYGGRSLSSMAYVDELKTHKDRVVFWPQDESGLLPLDSEIVAAGSGTAIYCCGPEPLLQALQGACRSRPDTTLHFERFAASSADTIDEGAGSFVVELSDTGQTFEVPPDRSILDILEEVGVAVLSSCRTGSCGTCEVEVIEGIPDHRDSFLTEHEKQSGKIMLVCRSRAHSPKLVLRI